jgi:hypothetical protein
MRDPNANPNPDPSTNPNPNTNPFPNTNPDPVPDPKSNPITGSLENAGRRLKATKIDNDEYERDRALICKKACLCLLRLGLGLALV